MPALCQVCPVPCLPCAMSALCQVCPVPGRRSLRIEPCVGHACIHCQIDPQSHLHASSSSPADSRRSARAQACEQGPHPRRKRARFSTATQASSCAWAGPPTWRDGRCALTGAPTASAPTDQDVERTRRGRHMIDFTSCSASSTLSSGPCAAVPRAGFGACVAASAAASAITGPLGDSERAGGSAVLCGTA